MSIIIKQASIKDFEEIHRMILDFASFQKTPEKVYTTVEQMQADAALIKALIIEDDGQAVGFATYYFGYSSWSGKNLFLDDIYLEKPYRRKGIGDLVMDNLEVIAKAEQCRSMRWLVSKWNESAIEFYKRRGASIDGREYTCQLNL